MSFRILATVSGGRTGHREAWLKQAGDLFETDSLSYAERMATDLNKQANGPHATARFHYKVVEVN